MLTFVQVGYMLIAPWFLDESVRWLTTQGKVDEALAIVKKIAKKNGKKVHEDVFTQFKQVLSANDNNNGDEDKKVKQRSMLDLFRKKRLRRNMIISFLSWTLIVTLADAHARNVVNVKFSFYESVALFCTMEMPGELTAIWSVNNLGE